MLKERRLKIAPSTYYAHLGCRVSPAVLDEAYLVNALMTLHRANLRGLRVRKMWHLMRRECFAVGRDQVGRLIRSSHLGCGGRLIVWVV